MDPTTIQNEINNLVAGGAGATPYVIDTAGVAFNLSEDSGGANVIMNVTWKQANGFGNIVNNVNDLAQWSQFGTIVAGQNSFTQTIPNGSVSNLGSWISTIINRYYGIFG